MPNFNEEADISQVVQSVSDANANKNLDNANGYPDQNGDFVRFDEQLTNTLYL